MTYNKPELTVLGDAAVLIQGSKGAPIPDNGSLVDLRNPSDSELFD
jgi:hypothetical protein